MPKPTSLISLVITLLIIFSARISFSSDSLSLQNRTIIETLNYFSSYFPGQKVYLHTDKDNYHIDETIWYKAYVSNAMSHKSDTLSGNLIVELINSNGNHIRRNVLPIDNGTAHGSIALPDSLPDGNYVLRAYTNWMRNFGEDFYFHKNLYLHNPEEENYIGWSDRRRNRRFNRKLNNKTEERQFAFFPEGGTMVYGIESKVAFKAANAIGRGVEVTGRVVDDSGREISTFKSIHDGMGMFSFTPEKGNEYKAEIFFSDGTGRTFSLPGPLEKGFMLAVAKNNEALDIRITAQTHGLAKSQYESIFLLAQNGGRPFWAAEAKLKDTTFTVHIPKNKLPPGITHITLFDGLGAPVAERLVFIPPNQLPDIEISRVESEPGKDINGKSEWKLTTNYPQENFIQGSYSISVVKSFSESMQKPLRSLSSYLLLESEILATIENPFSYFCEEGKFLEEKTELLMLTHGWRRFDWEPLLDKTFPEINYGFSRGLTVAGNVRGLASAEAVENVLVEMEVTQEQKANRYTTQTDDEGNFLFSGLHYYDVFIAHISMPHEHDERNLWVDLAFSPLPGVDYMLNVFTKPQSITSKGENWERTRRPETRLRAAKRAKPRREEQYFGRPDQIIYSYDIAGHYSNMMDLIIGQVRGVNIDRGVISLRGMKGTPAFVVDGIMVHGSTFMAVNPSDIDRMEVMQGSTSAIFGSRGGDGALIVYTKRGDETTQRTFEFFLAGYPSPEEFYKTYIDTELYNRLDIKKTLYWEPEFVLRDDGPSMIEVPGENTENAFILIEGINELGQTLSWYRPLP